MPCYKREGAQGRQANQVFAPRRGRDLFQDLPQIALLFSGISKHILGVQKLTRSALNGVSETDV